MALKTFTSLAKNFLLMPYTETCIKAYRNASHLRCEGEIYGPQAAKIELAKLQIQHMQLDKITPTKRRYK